MLQVKAWVSAAATIIKIDPIWSNSSKMLLYMYNFSSVPSSKNTFIINMTVNSHFYYFFFFGWWSCL